MSVCECYIVCEYALHEKMKLIFIALEEGEKNERKNGRKKNSDQIDCTIISLKNNKNNNHLDVLHVLAAQRY